MQYLTLDNDINVFCITATSFPAGIMEAHQKLRSMFAPLYGRNFFGISAPNAQGTIIYKAAAQDIQTGEAEKLGCEQFIIKKGIYAYIQIADYLKNIESISTAFAQLTHLPNKDPMGCCVEWYMNENEVRCMIRMKD